MKETIIDERAIQFAHYIIDSKDTVRGTAKKFGISKSTVHKDVTERLQKINPLLAKEVRKKRTSTALNMDEFTEKINTNQGYIKTMWCGSAECEEKIHELTGAKSRCIPFEQEHIGDKCVYCGKEAHTMVVWGRQY